MDLAERLLGPQFEAALEEILTLEGYTDGCVWVSPLSHRGEQAPVLAKAIRELHARLEAAKAELKDVDHSLAGHEAFDMNRTTAIESLKARLEAQMQANLKLANLLAAAKAEGAAEAYEAEAQDWEALAKSIKDLQSQTARRAFERRAVEARERAAALRKQVQG